MARWRLKSAHYLSVSGTEWQYSEIDRQTSRPKTVKFAIPKHLDPNIEQDWNVTYRNNLGQVVAGDIIVCLPEKGESGDYEFTSDLTPDMEPLDEEATVLSEKMEMKWQRPKEAIPGEPFAQSLLAHLESQTTNKQEELEGLQRAVTTLAEQMSSLVAALQPKAATLAERRV